MRNIFQLRRVVQLQNQPVVLSNNSIIIVQYPEKVHTVEQASEALQAPFEEEMQTIIDAKLLREQIAEAEALLAQLELDRELAGKRFKLVEKMVAASGFRPMRPSPEDGILVPYAIEENLDKGLLIASVNGSKGSNAYIPGQ